MRSPSSSLYMLEQSITCNCIISNYLIFLSERNIKHARYPTLSCAVLHCPALHYCCCCCCCHSSDIGPNIEEPVVVCTPPIKSPSTAVTAGLRRSQHCSVTIPAMPI